MQLFVNHVGLAALIVVSAVALSCGQSAFGQSPQVGYVGQFGGTGSDDGKFNTPKDIAINSTHIIVADTLNNRIQIFGLDGVFQAKFGTSGLADGQFNSLQAVAITSTSIFAVDDGHPSIQRFDLSGRHQTTFGDSGSGTNQIRAPSGIAVDSDIYVTDAVRSLGILFGSDERARGEFGNSGTGKLTGPVGITVNSTNIIVADTGGHNIKIFTRGGGLQQTFGSSGSDNGEFDAPIDVALTQDYMLVTDGRNHRVQVFDKSGNYLSEFGSSGIGNGQFNTPRGIAVTEDGRIFVVDEKNDRVQEFAFCPVGQTAATGVCAELTCTAPLIPVGGVCVAPVTINHLGSFAGEGTNALADPEGIDANSTHIIVADSTAAVAQVFHRNGTFVQSISGNTPFSEPTGVALTSENILVADFGDGEVQIFDTDGTYSTVVSGLSGPTGVEANSTHWFIADLDQPALYIYDNTGTREATITDQIPSPYDAEVTANAIIVADNGGSVQAYDHSGTHTGTIANAGDPFTNPIAVASTTRHIFVADSTGNKVQIFNHNYEYVGQFGTFGSGAEQISNPSGVVATEDGRIYVSDTDNARIQEFSFCVGDQTIVGDSCRDPICAEGKELDTSTKRCVDIPCMITQTRTDGVCRDKLTITYLGDLEEPHLVIPQGIAANSTHILVTDDSDSAVRIFHHNGTYAAEFGSEGSEPGDLLGPNGLDINSTHILVADTGNRRISVFDHSGVPQSQHAGTFTNSAGTFNLDRPEDVVIGPAHIYVTDTGHGALPIYDLDMTRAGYGGNLPLGGSLAANSTHVFASDLNTDEVLLFDAGANFVLAGLFGGDGDPLAPLIAKPNGLGSNDDYVFVGSGTHGTINILDHSKNLLGLFNVVGSESGPSDPVANLVVVDEVVYVVNELEGTVQMFRLCAHDQTYEDGICNDFECNTGQTPIEGMCVDTVCVGEQTYDRLAGQCADPVCLDGQTLTGGSCVDPDCGSQLAVRGSCVDPITINYLSQFGSFGDGDDQFNLPNHLEANSTHVMVIDSDNGRIKLHYRNGTFASLVLGTLSVDGLTGLATDAAHIIVTEFVADFVRVFRLSEISGLLEPQFVIESIDQPLGVDIGTSHFFVADDTVNNVHVFDYGGIEVGTLSEDLADPADIEVTESAIIVADFDGSAVHRFNHDRGYLGLRVPDFDGTTYTVGYHEDYAGTIINAGDPFTNPIAVASTTHHILVADNGADKVQVFNHFGEYLGQFGGSGTGDGQFDSPAGIVATADGRIFVADSVNHRIQEFNFCLGDQSFIAGGCVDPVCRGDTAPDPATGTCTDTCINEQEFNTNTLLCEDPVCTGDTILVNGTCIAPIAINHVGSFAGEGANALDGPWGVEANSTHVIVADNENDRVQVYHRNGTFAQSIPGSPAFSAPESVGLSGTRMLVADSTGNVQVLNADGSPITQITGLLAPTGLGANSTHLFVADQLGDTVYIYDNAGTQAATITDQILQPTDVEATAEAIIVTNDEGSAVNPPPPGTVQAYNHSGGHIGAIANAGDAFELPIAAASTSRHIFILDQAEHKVQVFDHNHDYLGQFGAAGTGEDQFTDPSGIAATEDGRIYVSDNKGDRVQEFSLCVGHQTLDGDGVCQAPVCDGEQVPVRGFCEDPITLNRVERFGGQGSGDGQLEAPLGIAANSTHVIVADTGNDRIQIFDHDGDYLAQFGGTGTGEGQFDSPSNVAVTSERIIVFDTGNDRVQLFDLGGEFVLEFDAGHVGARTQINHGIAANSTHIIVADADDHLVRIFDYAGIQQDQFGGERPTSATGDPNGLLAHPGDVAINSTHIIVTDPGQVQIFDHSGNYLTRIPNPGFSTYASAAGVAIMANHIAVVSSFPAEIYLFDPDLTFRGQYVSSGTAYSAPAAVGDGSLFVVDETNHRVDQLSFCRGDQTLDGDGICQDPVCDEDQIFVNSTKICSDGIFIDYVSQFGSAGSGDGQFNGPTGVDANSTHVIVADFGNNRVQVYHRYGVFASTIGLPASVTAWFPTDVHLAPDLVAVTDRAEGAAYLLDGDGTLTNTLSTSTLPAGIATNDTHIFIADQENDEVDVFTLAGVLEDTFTVASANAADGPNDVALAEEEVIVVDYTDQVTRLDYSGNHIGTIANPDEAFTAPASVDLIPGYILVADEDADKVQIFNHQYEYLGQFGESGTGEGQLDGPTSLAATADGRIFVADSENNRIQEFSFCVGHQTLVNDVCVDPTCIEDTIFDPTTKRCDDTCVGDQTFDPATSICVDPVCADRQIVEEGICRNILEITRLGILGDPIQLGSPSGIATNATHVLVADTADDTINIFHHNGTFVSAFGGTGSGAGELSSPNDVALNSTHIIVADTGNARVSIFNHSGTPESQSSGTGTALQAPSSVAVTDDRIYAMDTSATELLIYNHSMQFEKSGGAYANGGSLGANSTHVLATNSQSGQVFTYDGDDNLVTDATFGTAAPPLAASLGVGLTDDYILVGNSNTGVINIYNHSRGYLEGFDTTLGIHAASGVSDLAVTAEGRVYVVDDVNGLVHMYRLCADDQILEDGRCIDLSCTEAQTAIEGVCVDTGCTDTQTYDRTTKKCTEPLDINYVRQFGSTGSGVDQFDDPVDIVANSTHIIVANVGNNRIKTHHHNGTFVSSFGSPGSADGQFSGITAMDVTPDNIVVADQFRSDIQIFDRSATHERSFQVTFPQGMAINSTHIMHVERTFDNSNNKVRIYDYDGVEQHSFDILLEEPRGMAANSTHILVTSNTDHIVGVYNHSGDLEGFIGGPGDGDGQFSAPYGVTITEEHILVADEVLDRVQVFDHDGTYRAKFTGNGTDVFDNPRAAAVSPQGRIYVADDDTTVGTADQDVQDRVMVFSFCEGDEVLKDGVCADPECVGDQTLENGLCIDPTCIGERTAVAGICTDPVCEDTQTIVHGTCTDELQITFARQIGGVDAGEGQLASPVFVTTNSTHIIVTESGNNTVSIFHQNGTYAAQFGEVGSGDGQFESPYGVAINSTHIIVADQRNHRIQIFNHSGEYAAEFGTEGTGNGQFNNPSGLAITDTRIMVADTDNNRVQVFNHSGVYVSEFGGTGAGDGQLGRPSDVAVDSAGQIFVADTGNNRIQVFDSDGEYVSQFGGFGTGDGQLNGPTGVFVEGQRIFVSDSTNSRVQVFDLTGRYLAQFGESGTGEGQFSTPFGVYANSTHILFVDTINSRVQVLEYSTALTCPDGEVFVGSTCQVITCPAGQEFTETYDCVDICPTGQIRENGVCVTPPACIGQQTLENGVCIDPDCRGAQVARNGICVDPPRDRDNGRSGSGGGGGGGSSSGRHSGAEVCGDRLCSEIEEERATGITPTPTTPAEYVCDPDLDFTDGYVSWSKRIFEWHDDGLIDEDTFCTALGYLDSRGLLPES